MDKLVKQIQALADFVNRTPALRVVYAALCRTRSSTPPMPYVGLVFQAIGEYREFVVAGRQTRLPHGHISIISTHQGTHTSTPVEDTGFWVVTLDVGTDPAFAALARHPQLLTAPVVRREALTALYATVAERYLQTGGVAQLRLKAAILELMTFALEETSGAGSERLAPPFVEAAESHMRSHLAEAQLTVGNIAQAAHVSVRHLDRLFRKWRGMSPMQYLRDLRLRRARALLESSGLRVSEIAREVGFEDPLHFSRVFRVAMGCSPLAHRKTTLNPPDHY
jgi:AraC-like DNA-binding protein